MTTFTCDYIYHMRFCFWVGGGGRVEDSCVTGLYRDVNAGPGAKLSITVIIKTNSCYHV